MIANQELVDRVRKALSHLDDVTEKNMFGIYSFMVHGKMCIGVGEEEMLCRIDPALHDEAVQQSGCRAMEVNGRIYKGYIFVHEDAIRPEKDFGYWVQKALEYNTRLLKPGDQT